MKYVRMLPLLLLPSAAGAAEGLGAHADVYYIPVSEGRVTVTSSAGGVASDSGDGFGAKGEIALPVPVVPISALVEYQTTSYDDLDVDVDQMRVGAGFFSKGGSGLILEWLNIDAEDAGDTDGYGLHYRARGWVTDAVSLQGQVGYLSLDDSGQDVSGFEYSLELGWSIQRMIGVYAGYRVTDVEAEDDNVQFDFADYRLGARISF